MPSPTALKEALRAAVRAAAAADELDQLSVNKVRSVVEKNLTLEAGFFLKPEWKDQSKQIVKDEAARCEEAGDKEHDIAKPSKSSPPKTIVKSPGKSALPSRPAGKGKRARNDEDKEDSERSSTLIELEDNEADEQPKKKRAKSGKTSMKTSSTRKTKDHAPKQKVVKVSSEVDFEAAKPPTSNDLGDNSESEMSVVLDEAPVRKKSNATSTKLVSKPKTKPIKDADPNIDPEETEIKRLQSWLLKCGVRKLWHRELASYDTPRAKIKHLKGMLSDLGMDGRFSAEKARQIKEERELKADLEAVKGFAERWGEGNDEDDVDVKGRSKRKLAKGLTELAMFDDDDESD